MYRKFDEIWVVIEIYRQTDRHDDHNTSHPTGDKVTNAFHSSVTRPLTISENISFSSTFHR